MGEAIEAKRVLRLLGVYLNNVDLEGVPDDFVEWALQHPREAGEQFSFFLRNKGTIMVNQDRVLHIKRKKRPESEWSTHDEPRSAAIERIELDSLVLDRTGEDRNPNLVHLDEAVFNAFLERQYLIPESWKDFTGRIFFLGTCFNTEFGAKNMFLIWCGDEWSSGWDWMSTNDAAAALKV